MLMLYDLQHIVSLIVDLPYGWEKVDDPQYGIYYIEYVLLISLRLIIISLIVYRFCYCALSNIVQLHLPNCCFVCNFPYILLDFDKDIPFSIASLLITLC